MDEAVIILTSPSAFLQISHDSPDCAMTLTKDRQYLTFTHQKPGKTIHSFEISLCREYCSKEISTLKVEFTHEDATQRVRIDAFYPLVFKENETIHYAELERDTNLFTYPETLDDYTLLVTINPLVIGRLSRYHRKPEVKTPLTSIATVKTERILAESRPIAVSKELLALSSAYFTSFFYGNYQEKDRETRMIKEVVEDDFADFMVLLHKRRFELPSVKSGLIALGFADYFGMTSIMAKSSFYLLKNALPKELLNDGLVLADKLPNNTEILEWVIKAIPTSDTFFQVLHGTMPMVSAQTVQYCLKKLQERTNATFYPDLSSLKASLSPGMVAIRMKYEMSPNTWSAEQYLSVPRASRPSRISHVHIVMRDVCRHVPSDVSKISINGKSYSCSDVSLNGEVSIRRH